MLRITPTIWVDIAEISFKYIRSPGPGGQNVNKVATAVLLRFDVRKSPSLPDGMRQRLLSLLANRLTQEGELLIKASNHRTQERNRQEALDRLVSLLKKAAIPPKKRKKTKPTKGSVERRLTKKKLHGKRKELRGKPRGDE